MRFLALLFLFFFLFSPASGRGLEIKMIDEVGVYDSDGKHVVIWYMGTHGPRIAYIRVRCQGAEETLRFTAERLKTLRHYMKKLDAIRW